jgi:hypothetical protein
LTNAISDGIEMLEVLKDVDAKDAKGVRVDLQVQGESDDVTLAQLRLMSDSDVPASECRACLIDALERRRVERLLMQSAVDKGDWSVAETIASTSLRVSLDLIDREEGAMTQEQLRLAAGLKRLVGKWRAGFLSP